MGIGNTRWRPIAARSSGGIENKRGGVIATQGTFTPTVYNSFLGAAIGRIVTSAKAANAHRYYGSYIVAFSKALSNGQLPGKRISIGTSGGTTLIGTQTAGKYVGMIICTQLAGVAKTNLSSPGAYPNKGRTWPAAKTLRITRHNVQAGWNRATGALLVRPIITTDYFGNNFAAPGRDDAALNPSTSNSAGYSRIPGEFVYLTSSKIPTHNVEYSHANLD